MKPTLIIADDVKMLRDGLRRILTADFEIVAEAADGVEVLEVYKKFRPQLIVMDVVMPRMSGIEAARLILSGPGPHPKIVMVSGLKEEMVVLQALEAGASDYLFKPVDPDKLRAVLQGFARSAA